MRLLPSTPLFLRALLRFGRHRIVVAAMTVTLVGGAALGAMDLLGYRYHLKSIPPEAAAATDLCSSLIDRGSPAIAIPHCREAVRLAPEYALAQQNLGLALRNSENYRDAIPVLREAVRLDPTLQRAHNALGSALWGVGQFSEAEAEYRAALRLNPDYAKVHFNLGKMLEEMGRSEDSITEYQELVRVDSNDAVAYSALGAALYRTNHLPEAEKTFRQAILLDPDAESYWNLGMVLQKRGDIDAAIDAFQTAIQRNPLHWGALNSLSSLLLQKKKFAEALAAVESARAILTDSGIELNQGAALYGLGRKAEARKVWKAVLSMPDANIAEGKTTPAARAKQLLRQNPL